MSPATICLDHLALARRQRDGPLISASHLGPVAINLRVRLETSSPGPAFSLCDFRNGMVVSSLIDAMCGEQRFRRREAR
jgi:hypothetical protein